jgi:hypothetical protein
VSYQGVRAAFPVSAWKARFWFVILPALFYAFLFARNRWWS